MEWVWPLFQSYIKKRLCNAGATVPDDDSLESEFIEVLSGSSVTVLVQEPWRGSVRFKCLGRFDSGDMFDLLNAPETYLRDHFGGGKFKLNFHHGWHFVATQNFKPDGDPRWMDLPEFELETA